MKPVSTVVIGFLTVGSLLSYAQGAQSQWDGVYTVEQAKRGATLYEAKCSVCHGSDLAGGQMAPPLVGKDFTTVWNDLPLADLFELIRVSMPQNEPGTLTNAEAADLLAYVLQSGSYPAGTSELPGDPEQLKKLRFAATGGSQK
jgi:mono/diheme cytochrome c family protein